MGAQYHVARAKTIDEQEKELRRRQATERERFRQEQETILRAKEEERRAQLADKVKARQTYKEKMVNAMKLDVIDDTPASRKGGGRGGGGGRRKRGEGEGKETKKERRKRKMAEKKERDRAAGVEKLSA